MTLPELIRPDHDYLRFLEQGRFMIQRCTSGSYFFYPRVAEPGTGSTSWEWVEASGEGTVYSTTVVRQKTGDFNVALIDLTEGPRLMSRVVGLPPEAVRIGMRVRARVDRIDGSPAVVFEPKQEPALA